MGTMPRTVRLDPPPARGGLRTLALPLPAGWQRGGIAFASTGCMEPFTVGQCPTGDHKRPDRPGPVETFVPIQVGAAVECSTLGGELYPSGDVLDQVADFALTEELLYGSASRRDDPDLIGNPSVVGSITATYGDLADVVAAFGCVEQYAAQLTSGRQLWLHTSVAAATAAADAGLLWRDGTVWRTAYGSVVHVTPLLGFQIANLSGMLPAGITSDPVIATLPVYAGVGQRDELMDYDRQLNTATSRTEDLALTAFDPCAVVAAGTGVSCTVPTAPTRGGTPPPPPPPPPPPAEPCDDPPTMNDTKQTILQWLADAGLPIPDDVQPLLVKAELLQLADALCNDDTDAAAQLLDSMVHSTADDGSD